MDFKLIVEEKYHNTLDIESFSFMMKDPSYCYKFYWLEAIVQLISRDIHETTFDEIINEMICNAWYSVREFHIHLSGIQMDGKVRDGLERAVLLLSELSNLSSNASKEEIRNAIKSYDAQLKSSKEQLTNMVPYRALSAFFRRSDEPVNWDGVKKLVAYISKVNKESVLLPYTLGDSSRLKKEVFFSDEWIRMIHDYTVPIMGWIQNEKLKWLQNNNPEVPGLVYKLKAMDDKVRKLNQVHKLWDAVMELKEVIDIFTERPVNPSKYDVDHFIPWSFVMNDELWNLMPMDSSLNSAKSNRLPEWNPFFKKFAQNQFDMYKLIHDESLPGIHKIYESCFKDNLHSIWANQELYRKGNSENEFYSILEKNMRPVYDSARRQGYELWVR